MCHFLNSIVRLCGLNRLCMASLRVITCVISNGTMVKPSCPYTILHSARTMPETRILLRMNYLWLKSHIAQKQLSNLDITYTKAHIVNKLKIFWLFILLAINMHYEVVCRTINHFQHYKLQKNFYSHFN